MMAHGDNDLAIGDEVTARFAPFAGRLVPYFEKDKIMSRLKAALDPKSVAIIGASENPNKVGGRPVHYLDKFGFKGKIFPINPSRAGSAGLPVLQEPRRSAGSARKW